jgi:hypothetical protein
MKFLVALMIKIATEARHLKPVMPKEIAQQHLAQKKRAKTTTTM